MNALLNNARSSQLSCEICEPRRDDATELSHVTKECAIARIRGSAESDRGTQGRLQRLSTPGLGVPKTVLSYKLHPCGPPPRTVADPAVVVGYTRVSTDEQAVSGLGLAAQRAAIETECARRNWTLLAIHQDAGASGKTMDRPGLADALADAEQGRAAALVVSKVDRLSRSAFDFVGLLERAQRSRWALVALDVNSPKAR